MPYNKKFHGHVIYLSFVSLDKDVSGFKAGDIFQCLLGTYNNKQKTITAIHTKTGQKETLSLENITPRLNMF